MQSIPESNSNQNNQVPQQQINEISSQNSHIPLVNNQNLQIPQFPFPQQLLKFPNFNFTQQQQFFPGQYFCPPYPMNQMQYYGQAQTLNSQQQGLLKKKESNEKIEQSIKESQEQEIENKEYDKIQDQKEIKDNNKQYIVIDSEDEPEIQVIGNTQQSTQLQQVTPTQPLLSNFLQPQIPPFIPQNYSNSTLFPQYSQYPQIPQFSNQAQFSQYPTFQQYPFMPYMQHPMQNSYYQYQHHPKSQKQIEQKLQSMIGSSEPSKQQVRQKRAKKQGIRQPKIKKEEKFNQLKIEKKEITPVFYGKKQLDMDFLDMNQKIYDGEKEESQWKKQKQQQKRKVQKKKQLDQQVKIELQEQRVTEENENQKLTKIGVNNQAVIPEKYEKASDLQPQFIKKFERQKTCDEDQIIIYEIVNKVEKEIKKIYANCNDEDIVCLISLCQYNVEKSLKLIREQDNYLRNYFEKMHQLQKNDAQLEQENQVGTPLKRKRML